MNVPPAVNGSWPLEKFTGLGSCSNTNSFLISPGRTPAMFRPA